MLRVQLQGNIPRSNGCVKNVAKQLALPPNQNGYDIGVTFTSLLLLTSEALSFLVRAAIVIAKGAEGACIQYYHQRP
jgi:hypothetical protein